MTSDKINAAVQKKWNKNSLVGQQGQEYKHLSHAIQICHTSG